MYIFTPCPRISSPGITLSLDILCSTLGVPYIAPRHELIELTYKPASKRTFAADISAVIAKFVCKPSLVTVAARVIMKVR